MSNPLLLSLKNMKTYHNIGHFVQAFIHIYNFMLFFLNPLKMLLNRKYRAIRIFSVEFNLSQVFLKKKEKATATAPALTSYPFILCY